MQEYKLRGVRRCFLAVGFQKLIMLISSGVSKDLLRGCHDEGGDAVGFRAGEARGEADENPPAGTNQRRHSAVKITRRCIKLRGGRCCLPLVMCTSRLKTDYARVLLPGELELEGSGGYCRINDTDLDKSASKRKTSNK